MLNMFKIKVFSTAGKGFFTTIEGAIFSKVIESLDCVLNKLIGIANKIYRNVLGFLMGNIERAYWWLNIRMLVYKKCSCNSG